MIYFGVKFGVVWRIFWQRLIDDFGGMGIQRQLRIIGVGIRCGRIRGVFFMTFLGWDLVFPFELSCSSDLSCLG